MDSEEIASVIDMSSDEGRVNDVLLFRENSLHGPTKWRFPITLGCPYAQCGREFRSRESAISHYRDAHFRGLTYCRVCERPIGAKKFANHLLSQKHRSMQGGDEQQPHGGERNAPTASAAVEMCSTPSDPGSDNPCSSSDTFQMLTIGSAEKRSWRFPDHNSCPLKGCRAPCQDRAAAVEHFRRMHAAFCILCIHCNTPLSMKAKTNIPLHYSKKHPNLELPNDWLQNWEGPKNQEKAACKAEKVVKPSTERLSQRRQSTGSAIVLSNQLIAGSRCVPQTIAQPSECSSCGQTFAREADMRQHLRQTHQLVHTCQLCDPKAYISPSLTRAHYLEMHNMFVDMCPFCGAFFLETGSFKRHLMVHSEVNQRQATAFGNYQYYQPAGHMTNGIHETATNTEAGSSFQVVYIDSNELDPTASNELLANGGGNDAGDEAGDATSESVIADERAAGAAETGHTAADNDNGSTSQHEDETAEAADTDDHKFDPLADRRRSSGAVAARDSARLSRKRKAHAEKYASYKKRKHSRPIVYQPTARKSTAKPTKPTVRSETSDPDMPPLDSDSDERSAIQRRRRRSFHQVPTFEHKRERLGAYEEALANGGDEADENGGDNADSDAAMFEQLLK